MKKQNNGSPLSRIAIKEALVLLFLALCLPSLAQDKNAELAKSSTRRLHCMGQSWKLPVRNTTDPSVVMIRADHPALFEMARALGKNLHWSTSDTKLTGEAHRSVALGQRDLEVFGQSKTLELVPQLIDGAVHVPSSALEGLLDCRVTVKDGKTGSIYVEPALLSMSFAKQGPNSADLVTKTSVPVRKKVFNLKNPNRTVVDLMGVAVPKNLEKLEHPILGEIRVGQFQLAPSITRIVLPNESGIKVKTDRTMDLFEHQLSITWPAGTKPVAQGAGTPERVPTIVIQPTEMPERVGEPVVVRRPPTPTPPSQEEPPQTSTTISNRPTLSEVEWDSKRLKLTFSEPISYRWSRVNTDQKRYVIDFPGVIFPQKKQQLASQIPGLQTVRIVQNMPEPNPIVRLVCDLDTAIVVDAKGSDERVLYLSFPGRQMSASDLPRGLGNTSKQVVAAGTGSASGRTVCIDPGHGGSDPGALNRSVGVNEASVTLDISMKLAQYLKAQGWNVIMTRTSDRDVSWAGSSAKQELGARAQRANEHGADLFVSIHANASVNAGAGGTSIHWYKAGDYRLATLLEDGVMSATGRSNRGLVKDRFYVLAHTEMPAVLIETAFLSNPTEGKLLADPQYRDRIAQGIAAGLQVYAARTFTSASAKQ